MGTDSHATSYFFPNSGNMVHDFCSTMYASWFEEVFVFTFKGHEFSESFEKATAIGLLASLLHQSPT
jgi:hypothetical protein